MFLGGSYRRARVSHLQARVPKGGTRRLTLNGREVVTLWDLIHVATVDVQRGYGGAFDRWYNEVHVPELLDCPGWLTARRFECTDGQPRFLAIYELADEHVAFGSTQYAQAFGWDEFATRIRNSHGRNYRLIQRAKSQVFDQTTT